MRDPANQASSAIDLVLREVFGFSAFRPLQRDVCLSAWRGRDVLLVMPTGAGKSLCYQLPSVARQESRTLVVSPLISLIEDQCAKLTALGIPTGRIHSGLARTECQAACRLWQDGRLKFLFVAPERLSHQGFAGFLERHKPTMIAVDEAHCISMWGHDFRSDYRHLGEKLARLRPASIVALTATATPDVQRDIVSQLQMQDPHIFIHGFRRENIAISIKEILPEQRVEALGAILADEARRPCIVYAPTRRNAEMTAYQLAGRFRIGAFHAGMSPDEKSAVQSGFMNGDLDVIVATSAFGMGIDKRDVRTVVHLAASGSVEAYYQEIGRAGRDGLPSLALLMYSAVDRKTLNYFFDQNYPATHVLSDVFSSVTRGFVTRDEIAEHLKMPVDVVRVAMEKLWVHGGLATRIDGSWCAGDARWRSRYEGQRCHRAEQLKKALSFPTSEACRMSFLVEHFGESGACEHRCGICDRCSSEEHRKFSDDKYKREIASWREEFMLALLPHSLKASGQLYRDLSSRSGWDRGLFESVLWDLEVEGFLRVSQQDFQKDGRTVRFQLIGLTDGARHYLAKHNLAPAFAAQIAALERRRSSGGTRGLGKRRSMGESIQTGRSR